MHTNCTTRFKNVIFRHHYGTRKNSSCIETEQCYLCRVLHFNRQNLMLITSPNYQATAYDTYWKYLTEHWKILWDVPTIFFSVTPSSGKPTPELCFLPEVLRWIFFPNSAAAIHPRIEHPTFQLRGGLSVAAPTKCSSPMPTYQVMLWCSVGVLLRNQW